MAEDCSGGVASVGVDEHAGDDAVSVKCLTVGKVSVTLAGIGRGVVPGRYEMRI